MKRPNPHKLPPDFESKEKAALVRRNRVTILLNDKEMDALNRYQKAIRQSSRAAICRDAIMEKVLIGLDEFHPTLF